MCIHLVHNQIHLFWTTFCLKPRWVICHELIFNISVRKFDSPVFWMEKSWNDVGSGWLKGEAAGVGLEIGADLSFSCSSWLGSIRKHKPGSGFTFRLFGVITDESVKLRCSGFTLFDNKPHFTFFQGRTVGFRFFQITDASVKLRCVFFGFLSLKLTKPPLKNRLLAQQGKDRFPTTIFQGRTVCFREGVISNCWCLIQLIWWAKSFWAIFKCFWMFVLSSRMHLAAFAAPPKAVLGLNDISWKFISIIYSNNLNRRKWLENWCLGQPQMQIKFSDFPQKKHKKQVIYLTT